MRDRRQRRIERRCFIGRIIIRLYGDGGIRPRRKNRHALQRAAARYELRGLAEQGGGASAGARTPGLARKDQRLIGGDYVQCSIFTYKPRDSCAGRAQPVTYRDN